MSAKANKDTRTKRELLEEMEALRARLDEAEQTLDAIRSGDVDALLVSGPDGDRIFSLTGAELTYRLIVETMNEAALTVDLDKTILFCNQRFCDLVRRPMTDIIGQKLTAFVGPAQQQPLRTLLEDARTGPIKRRLTLWDADGDAVSVQLAASLLAADGNTSICLVASDLTELEAQASSIRVLREQQQALEESRAELLAANTSLRDSRRAVLSVAEDAIAARRQAEETSIELRTRSRRAHAGGGGTAGEREPVAIVSGRPSLLSLGSKMKTATARVYNSAGIRYTGSGRPRSWKAGVARRDFDL